MNNTELGEAIHKVMDVVFMKDPGALSDWSVAGRAHHNAIYQGTFLPKYTEGGWRYYNKERKRPKRERGYWKENAYRVLIEMCPERFLTTDATAHGLHVSEIWLMFECRSKILPAKLEKFYKAVAMDIGVYPAPKWFLVRKKLEGEVNLKNNLRKTLCVYF